jgi:hypothetical protein
VFDQRGCADAVGYVLQLAVDPDLHESGLDGGLRRREGGAVF